jgi:hypothetical protein
MLTETKEQQLLCLAGTLLGSLGKKENTGDSTAGRGSQTYWGCRGTEKPAQSSSKGTTRAETSELLGRTCNSNY